MIDVEADIDSLYIDSDDQGFRYYPGPVYDPEDLQLLQIRLLGEIRDLLIQLKEKA